MSARALAAACAAAALILAVPAFAADPPAPSPDATGGDPALTAKVDAALANATSYRISVRAPNVAVEITSFGPDRVQIDATTGSAKTESIVVGTAMYYRTAGAPWQTFPVPAIKRVRRNRLYMGLPDALLQPLPDRVENGIALGAFRSQATGNAMAPGIMDCTYERGTFRPVACRITLAGSASGIDVSYGGWDDPSNAVEPPPGVPTPLQPLASPSPAPRRPS